ncbi:B-cell receptor CD22-like [Ascaphus truei]|uniref:B-cell receptor CD22-like n=1 Tax=Ascaphus truei TaxID=8439 RepID=UPI003F5AACB1
MGPIHQSAIKASPDAPYEPLLTGQWDLIEGKTVSITCSVEHTCASNPPSVQWNKAGHSITVHHEDLTGGNWTVISKIKYFPHYQDDKTQLECTATYPNGQQIHKIHTLSIKYSPKNTTITLLQSKEIKEGDDVTLICTSQANPDVNAYTWYKVGDDTQAVLQDHGQHITLRNVSRENEKYYCSVMNDLGRGNSSILEIPVMCSGCQRWSFSFPRRSITALKGSCVEIPCTFTRPKDTAEISVIWYFYRRRSYPQAFNNNNPSAVASQYRGRTSLVGNATNSCSLRIEDFRTSDGESYFPGINEEINSFRLNGDSVHIQVTDAPEEPLLTGQWDLAEGKTVSITCSVRHTCASNPPSMQWNKAGHSISVRHEDLTGGLWTVISEIKYYSHYQDDKTQLECTATYPNGQQIHKICTLSIKYSPKNTLITLLQSKEIKEGDDVTLMCTSQANPNVNNYTWYKVGDDTQVVLQDHNHNQHITLRNVSRENEKYYCSAMNDVGRGDSSILEIPVMSRTYIYVPVFAVSVIISLVLLLLIIYLCLRKRKSCRASDDGNKIREERCLPMEGQYSDRIYMNLMKRDSSVYDEMKPTPNHPGHVKGEDVIDLPEVGYLCLRGPLKTTRAPQTPTGTTVDPRGTPAGKNWGPHSCGDPADLQGPPEGLKHLWELTLWNNIYPSWVMMARRQEATPNANGKSSSLNMCECVKVVCKSCYREFWQCAKYHIARI